MIFVEFQNSENLNLSLDLKFTRPDNKGSSNELIFFRSDFITDSTGNKSKLKDPLIITEIFNPLTSLIYYNENRYEIKSCDSYILFIFF